MIPMRLAARAAVVVGLAFLTTGCGPRIEQREAQAERAYPPIGQFVEVDGRRVHAYVTGAGPDLVLIHGLSGNLRDFTFSFAERMARNYRVIAFDRPGMGYSDALPAGADGLNEQASALQDAADRLGAETPIVLGHSYGGAVALAWAVNHPEDIAAVVPVSAASHPWPGGLSLFYKVTSSRIGAATAVPLITAYTGEGTVNAALNSIFAPQSPPAGYDSYVGAGMALRRESLRVNARHRANLKEEIIVLQRGYSGLGLPVEIVHGTADTTVSIDIHARALAAEVRDANLTVLPGIGHAPVNVTPRDIAAAVDRAAARAGLR